MGVSSAGVKGVAVWEYAFKVSGLGIGSSVHGLGCGVLGHLTDSVQRFSGRRAWRVSLLLLALWPCRHHRHNLYVSASLFPQTPK